MKKVNDYTCTNCAGSGSDALADCYKCNGTGRVPDRRLGFRDRRNFNRTGTGRRLKEVSSDRRKKI